ncbi:MAG: response regulator transcription factor [Chitinophagales bacterium]|nr:response regulator transcription factor [Chitinophagales bacterium]
MKISCIAVDDVKLNREAMLDLISSAEFMEVVGSCTTALEASTLLKDLQPDVIFLDIEMPGMSGLELIKTLVHPPLIVLSTSHKEFAAEGFEMNVFDYLVKPVTHERFLKCVNKIYEYFKKKRPLSGDQIFIKSNNKFIKVKLNEILYVEAMRDFVVLYTDKVKLVTLMNLKEFTTQLPENQFLRIHRSYLIPINRVESIEGNVVKIQNHEIPIGESYRNKVLNQLLGKDD